MTGFQQGEVFYTTDKLIEGQKVVDEINKQRQTVRRNAHWRALCWIAAAAWIENNPITAAYYRQERLA